MDALWGAAPRPPPPGLDSSESPGSTPTATRRLRRPPLPWARFSSWLECVCVVAFDLELGQALELVYPYDCRLTEKEKTSICYLSFPDSYSGCLGDTQFSFRMRQSGGQRSPRSMDDDDGYNKGAPVTLQRETAHLFGYVYFRQVKDSAMKRGYFQKSLVLVSRLPYVNLFQSLLNLIAPEYFEKLVPCLEAVCNEIDQWPPPVPGQTLNLPVMGVVIQVRIPSRVDKLESSPVKQFNQENLLPAPLVLSSVNELDLFRCFQPVLIHIQLLWELMLLGEPLVVMAPSPTISSEMVLALTSSAVTTGPTSPSTTVSSRSTPPGPRPRDLPKQVKMKKLTKLKTLDTKPGLYTSYKTYLHKDKTLIKRLLKGIQRKRPSEVQSALVRRHLLELTQSFIIPLEHYMASLMPLQRAVTPWKTPPQIRPFRQDDFLKTLEHAGPQLTCVIKGDWLGLYRRFFKSPNFDGWYRQRHREMTQKLEALHLEVICEANILTWVKDKSEVEIVDLVLKLREKLIQAQAHQLPVKEETLRRVALYIDTVIGSLPDDLQTVLRHP
ncbi:protein DENND6B isoform X2 [Sminthopsis crassicaudata]|uniref:protein DENND6B isoform X2 n=1 Tax=Sminthopsis crassicaudata TaxID=9301 RepID=UPI003D69C35B